MTWNQQWTNPIIVRTINWWVNLWSWWGKIIAIDSFQASVERILSNIERRFNLIRKKLYNCNNSNLQYVFPKWLFSHNFCCTNGMEKLPDPIGFWVKSQLLQHAQNFQEKVWLIEFCPVFFSLVLLSLTLNYPRILCPDLLSVFDPQVLLVSKNHALYEGKVCHHRDLSVFLST